MNEDEELEPKEEKNIASKGKDALNYAKKSAEKSNALKGKLATAIGPIIFWAVVIIVILIVIVGIIMFFLTMPGMVMEKIKAIFEGLGSYVAGLFGADTTENVKEENIYETLDYLEEMGYDLKGYGFLTDYYTNSDKGDIDRVVESGTNYTIDEDVGVARGDDGKIVAAKSDFIFTYIVSDNYIYTLKNDNISTLTSSKDSGFWDKVWNIIKGTATLKYKINNFLFGPIFDFLGVTSGSVNRWGRGLLAFYYESGGKLGKKGSLVNDGTLWNWDSIKIDTDSKKLTIAKNRIFNLNEPLKYDLDGWVGRYGMPVEFLMSIHVATMMPDLAYDMATDFDTNVNIYLRTAKGQLKVFFKTESGEMIDYSDSDIQQFQSNTIDNISFKILTDKGLARKEHLEGTCGCVKTDRLYTNLQRIDELDGAFFCDEFGNEITDTSGYEYCYFNNLIPGYVVVKDLKEGEEYSIIDPECLEYVKKALAAMEGAGYDPNYETYIPYIASVTNHWFRDVYFVKSSNNEDLEIVSYDYDYEVLMKERWTLYETYSDDDKSLSDEYVSNHIGDFKLYVLDDDGNYDKSFDTSNNSKVVKDSNDLYLYLGTQEEAKEEKLTVSKKAVTLKADDNAILEDLGWNLENNIWSAYKKSDDAYDGELSPAYTDSEDEYKKNTYKQVHLTSGNINQTGEGQRKETNAKIKKKFLQNRYFRYDGTTETAELITKLRNDNNIKYGKLSDDDLDKTVTIGEKEYTVKDHSGQVSLNQDSLNAFSMLENVHTVDADYIYRDFKELVVELGYFSKQELTDETPKLLAWLVPDTGSGGYPNRTIDKRENEYGTMIHSKGDIDANFEYTLAGMEEEDWEAGVEDGDDPTDPDYEIPEQEQETNDTTSTESTETAKDVGANFDGANALANVKTTVGATGKDIERISERGDGYKYKVRVGSVEYTHFYQGMGSYREKHFYWGGGDRTIWRAGCGPTSCVNVLTGYGKDVNPTNTIVGLHFSPTMSGIKKLMDEHEVPGKIDFKRSEYGTEIQKAFDEGKPFITLMHASTGGDTFWTKGGHFVAFAGMDSSGDIYTLDPGSQREEREIFKGGIEGITRYMDGLWIPDEAPDGTGSDGDPYVGYDGNEAVISPVTGILLEYGLYDGNQKNSITDEEYRINVDLKYGPITQGEQYERQLVSDHVGYAKILVLDKENYQKIESEFLSSGKMKKVTSSLLTEEGIFKDDEKLQQSDQEKVAEYLKEWNDWDKTLYGYKEFVEKYELAGIAGNIIYIDGFIPEKPDENFQKTDITKKLPYGGNGSKENTYTMEESSSQISFKKTKLSNLDDKDSKLLSKYSTERKTKMISKGYTNKLGSEISIKSGASPSVYLNSGDNDLIVLKEGTVIGRTMTDKELIEASYLRNNQYGKYEELRPSKTDDDTKSAIIGNYIRIIMRDLDTTPVEDVEDYMVLTPPKSRILDDYDVHDETLFVTLDEFLQMFPRDKYPNIYDNAQAFIDMQDKYQVNAVFGACVTIVESGGGKGWDLIDPSTYNWVSIKGGKGGGYRDRKGNVWNRYSSFSDAIIGEIGLGDLISKDGGHYYAQGKYYVSEIGPIYCNTAWAEKCNKYMKEAYERIGG